jgi:hypothetical protein
MPKEKVSFEQVLSDVKKSFGLRRAAQMLLTPTALLTGCGAREEPPRREEERRESHAPEFEEYIRDFKTNAPACTVPPRVELKEAWNGDDTPLATTSSTMDFVWVNKQKFDNLSERQKKQLIMHELGHINGEKHPDGVRYGDEVADVMQPFGDSRHIDEWDDDEVTKRFFSRVSNSCSAKKPK